MNILDMLKEFKAELQCVQQHLDEITKSLEKPDALQIADALEKACPPFSLRRDLEPTLLAASKIRQMHEEGLRMLDLLQQAELYWVGTNGPQSEAAFTSLSRWRNETRETVERNLITWGKP